MSMGNRAISAILWVIGVPLPVLIVLYFLTGGGRRVMRERCAETKHEPGSENRKLVHKSPREEEGNRWCTKPIEVSRLANVKTIVARSLASAHRQPIGAV